MTEPLLPEPRLIMRAQRLLATSLAGPVIIFLAANAALILYGRPNSAKSVIPGVLCLVFIIYVTWVTYWGIRDKPNNWTGGDIVFGFLNSSPFLISIFAIRSGSQVQLNMPTFSVAAVVLVVCIFLIGWLPARRAAHLILDDLSVDVVDSSLILRFKSRVRLSNVYALEVTPDSIVVAWQRTIGRTKLTYPLADISTVAVRIAKRDGDYPLPGVEDGKVPITRGEVLVVEVPGGELVFPAKDVQRLKQFIEARRALVLAE
jgi:hypothetical protein